ncbi:MAG: SUMF1/EgtB/PvdO family nonheme iron enzyme [Deltaproteobacteria bacterium]|nr:SUMF1/EgtB/PvdO family nonheme iron enzyme [Deltaproteobacteria bacterium]
MKCPKCNTENSADSKFCLSCGEPLTRKTIAIGVMPPQQTEEKIVIGKNYEVVKKLGEGGMGVVFHAIHNLSGQEVAIKMLPPELSKDDGIRSRFINEARLLAKLDHPNIVTLYNFLEEDQKFYLIMQFVRGKTLEEYIKERGKLSIDEVVNIFSQVCDALGYAHQMGVVHRDIKPANIMITPDMRVKVMDFGIAKLTGGTRLTATGIAVGTVWYMSPEQIRGAELDARSDLYSLGVTLFEALTGKVPFDSESDYEVRKCHVEVNPPSPLIINNSLPKAAETILLKVLSKNPDDRYQSAQEFKKAIESLRSSPYIITPESQSQIGAQDLAQKSKGRSWIKISSVVAGIVIIGVVIYYFLFYQRIMTSNVSPLRAEQVYIPAGEFIMGSEKGEEDEKPVRKVLLSAFYIDKYEVTNLQYQRCVEARVCGAPQNFLVNKSPSAPVVGVSYNDAKTYCEWVKKRLPTEAEWEKAASQKGVNTDYPWGNDRPDCKRANFVECDLKIKEVGSFLSGASGYGVMDMAGNVAEWVADWYDKNAYLTMNTTNPKGPLTGTYRVIRGGSFKSSSLDLRKSNRMYASPSERLMTVGFRCARSE